MRLTAQSEPIILMEIMPAAMVASLLLLTYFVFAAGVGLIVRQNLEGTSTLRVPEDDAAVMETCSNHSSTARDHSVASASGCIDFYPNIFSTDLLEGGEERYGAVFQGYFIGMTDLYGSVSLHVSIANDTTLETLPNPAVVDLTLEGCTEWPVAGEELGSCDEGWAPVLNQVRSKVCNLLGTVYEVECILICRLPFSYDHFDPASVARRSTISTLSRRGWVYS